MKTIKNILSLPGFLIMGIGLLMAILPDIIFFPKKVTVKLNKIRNALKAIN